MTIRYHWENQVVNIECGSGISPHTKEVVRDVDYDYDRQISIQDIVDYLMPYNLTKKNKKKTIEEINETGLANFYMTKALSYLVHELKLSIELDDLENDEYFVEFMREKYKDSAYEEWQESNEAY